MALRSKVKVGPSSKKKSTKAQVPVEPAFDPLPIINAKFPVKATFKRKIVPLWDTFYRVNYHDNFNQNYVKYSHFIFIKDKCEVIEYV